MKHFIAFIICVLAAVLHTAQAKIEAVWSSDYALPGEEVVLVIQRIHDNNNTPTSIIRVSDLKLKNAGLARHSNFQNHHFTEPVYDADNKVIGRVEGVLKHIEVSRTGIVECADIEVTLSNGQKEIVPVPALPVYSSGELKPVTVREAGVPEFTFYTIWRHNQPEKCYVGQSIHASVKILVPTNYLSNNLPKTISKLVTAGDFHSPIQGGSNDILKQKWPLRNRKIKIRNQEWYVLDLEGDFILKSSDNAQDQYQVFTILPCEFTFDTTHTDSKGFTVNSKGKQRIELNLPALTFEKPLPLPPNPPADFCGQTGKFKLSASTDAKELAINEPITVQVTVKGNGMLEKVTCPTLRDARNWQLTSPSQQIITSPDGEPVAVVFTVNLRPTAEVSGIPAFSMSYFNADEGDYATAVSQPIGLPWKETETSGSGQVVAPNTPPPAGKVPVEELADIYHFMPDATENGNGAGITLPRSIWYLLYLPGLGIILWMLGKKAYSAWAENSGNRNKNKELNRIANEEEPAAFLKGIGAFIEKNIPTAATNEELQAILRKRDTEVFRPDASTYLSKEEKTTMLKTVRKALSCIITTMVLLCTFTQVCPAEDMAMKYYHRGQYSKALKILEEEQQAGTDTRDRGELLYNIGNCKYRLNKPGEAALYYARALQETPDLAEAKANLAFIQRKEGAILPQMKGADKVFTYLSYPQLWLCTVVCTAILLLSIALKLLLKGKLRRTVNATLGVSLLLSILCLVDYIYYSTRSIPDLTATPPHDLAYITQSTVARTAAIDTAEKVIDLPASTPVRVIATRGNQCYVETFTGVRGWIASDTAATLTPAPAESQPLLIRFK